MKKFLAGHKVIDNFKSNKIVMLSTFRGKKHKFYS